MLKISAKKKFTRKEVKEIGDKLGVDWKKIDLDEAVIGTNIELEHGSINPETNITDDDLEMSFKIMLAHCVECKKNKGLYYSELAKLEEKCKK